LPTLSEDDLQSQPEGTPEFEAEGYRPSVRLAAHEELRLLDQALDEARARPRPPAATYPAPPAPVRPPKRITQTVSIQGRVGDGRPDPPVLVADHATADRQENGASFDPVDEARRSESRRWRIDSADLLALLATESFKEPEADGGKPESQAGRKRLLAAIICILQEELTRDK
jgi:hypothetical protein